MSHYLDMGFIYVGLTVKEAIKNGGKFIDTKKELHKTIILGDERSAMFPQFYALSIIWIKFHNLVVDELKKHHEDLNPEILFYEARRFVIAVYQSVIYNEVLSMLLGKGFEKLQDTEGSSCYDPNLDPSVSVEFTASAARYYHTHIHNGYFVNFKNGTKSEILLRYLNDESIGYDELPGVITGGLEREWNSKDIAIEVKTVLQVKSVFLTCFQSNSRQTIYSALTGTLALT